MPNNYFDLTTADADAMSKLVIRARDRFECELVADLGSGNVEHYGGFLLAKSLTGSALTVCDIGFHKSGQDQRYQPRLTFRRTNEKLEDKNLAQGKTAVRIPFHTGEDGYREFWKMIAFLGKFKDIIDMGEFDGVYRVVTDEFIVAFSSQDDAEKVEDLRRMIEEGRLTEENIQEALADTRRATLEEFKAFLADPAYWETYQETHRADMRGAGEEACWHHFLKNNKWILGLNADTRFIRDLVSEAELGTPATSGSGSPSADMLGLSDYTVLIELKKPSTPIFTETKRNTARANTWSFTSDFIDGVSQCLGQKTDWEKNHRSKSLTTDDNTVVNQEEIRTIDPQCVFIIGNKLAEFPQDSADADVLCKRDTFQRYRRDSRNTDIVTYDELYERAYVTIYNKKPDMSFLKADNTDIPF